MKGLAAFVLLSLILALSIASLGCSPSVSPELTKPSGLVQEQSGLPMLSISNQDAILGKWRKVVPETPPPSMDQKLWEKYRQPPEIYYLEFLDNGALLYKNYEKNIFYDGIYRFINNKNVEIIWNTNAGAAVSGHGVYEVTINGNTMMLRGGSGINASWIREK